MKAAIAIRPRHRQRKQLHCALCGSTDHVERHHVGGRHHIAWFTVPLCRNHHVRLTVMLRQAGIDMSYTPVLFVRIIRARQAVWVFLWMLDEMEKNLCPIKPK